jgi:cytochrome c biogenesis protein CcdA
MDALPGPILTVLLTLASEQDTLVKGILLGVYSLGWRYRFC